MAGGSDTDNDTLTPSLMTGLEGGTHHTNITGTVKGIVTTAIGQLEQAVDDGTAGEAIRRVHEMGGAEPPGPGLLGRVEVDDDDAAGPLRDGALNDTEPHAAGTKDGHVGARLHGGGDAGRAVARGDAAAQQAGPVHGRVVLYRHHRDVGYYRVLGKGRGAHKVEQVFPFAPEPGGAVWHDASALGVADLATEVGLA